MKYGWSLNNSDNKRCENKVTLKNERCYTLFG